MQLLSLNIADIKTIALVDGENSVNLFTNLTHTKLFRMLNYLRAKEDDQYQYACPKCSEYYDTTNKLWLFYLNENLDIEYIGRYYDYMAMRDANPSITSDDLVKIANPDPYNELIHSMYEHDPKTYIYMDAIPNICPDCDLSDHVVDSTLYTYSDAKELILDLFNDDFDLVVTLNDDSYYTLQHADTDDEKKIKIAHYKKK